MMTAVNPTFKFIAILVPGVLLSFVYDVFTPLAYLTFLIVVTFTLSDISFKKWIRLFAPFALFALGFGWTAALYTNEAFSGGTVLFEFWVMKLTVGGLQTGLSITFRSLCFFAMSLLFIFTTDTTKFMMSLIHQCKVPPKIAYGIIAGYRFLPVFQHELQILRKAHQIRGMRRLKGIKGKLTQFQRYSIPLLANGIRKAERVAIAMESKGFTGNRERTYYHRMTVIKRDWLFLAMMVGVLFIVALLSYQLGYLKIFSKKM
ncbi:energy-coupling factor transporter transmembrane protein EcfT [Virgibacillus sp. MSJ-26]|uniref:energy-coupling factor transporter transmembrane component T family protein n=1 Tax=Virgibacillus sp. MSJ-26 TaxID=2841522 RepID=UPI001C11AE3A|nr:energy-coupling factor transporter transmembrane component T [Virgibacillus sp. MSJ-26]MBU5467094.1 energy-coupling factor transporter transmembrane protein EcfT [Virgibacillus sp. MSJ-26]